MSEIRTRRPRRRKSTLGTGFLIIAIFGDNHWSDGRGGSLCFTRCIFPHQPPLLFRPGDCQAQAKQINILLMGLDDGDNEHPGAPQRTDAMIVAKY